MVHPPLERHIRGLAKNSSNVIVTKHAALRMVQRGIPSSVVHQVLRNGRSNQVPVCNIEKDNLECLMEHFCAGSTIGIVVAICDENPNLVVVTAMRIS